MDRVARAKEIISQIKYVVIATASKDAQPWNTPVTAAFDETYNFYWTSMANTQHSKNIRENANVYIVIFDSTVPQNEGGAVYVKAVARELTDPAEITSASKILYARKQKPPRGVEEFVGDSPKRLYKAAPEQTWVNLDEDLKDPTKNPKIEISLT